MKVHPRGSTSPSPLIEPVNGDHFNFQIEPHHIVKGKRGQKVFVCDLCSPQPGSQFKRSFSLKRHYLRFHINFAFLSPRDLSNCAIVTNGKLQKNGYSSNQLNGKIIKTPLIYRCHKCGCLVKTKDDLISHLETHVSSSVDDNTIDGEKRGTNRCPRCSTAFSLRKTLMEHIKKNRCRGGSLSSNQDSMQDSSKSETDANDTETSLKLNEVNENGHENRDIEEEEDDDEDIVISMKLGCPTSLFRFTCILCAKLFDSYVNMCRHRRLAHGRYGVCSPQRLVTRKMLQRSHYESANSARLLASSLSADYARFVDNAFDNSTQFIEGKISTAVHLDDYEIEAAHSEQEKSVILSSRWSWGKMDYNFEELQKLDIPVQQAFHRGLQKWEIHDETPEEDEEMSEDIDVFSYLNLCPKKQGEEIKTEKPVPELSGEWARLKSYICLPCGEKYVDFYELLDHQHSSHAGVWCSHIQLDQEWETEDLVKELTRQLNRSGNGQPPPADSYECAKCHFKVNSVAELHSHILLCANHATTPKKKLSRSNSNGKEKRTAVNGRRRGMLRQFLRSSALNKANRLKEEKEREMNVKQIMKQVKKELTVRTPTKKSKAHNKEQLVPAQNKRVTSSTDTHQCSACKKKLKTQSSLLKHQTNCRRKKPAKKEERLKRQEPVDIKSKKKTKAKKAKEEPAVASRPVRSNRAAPENIVESSFFEALSVEQRKHVSNNTCPFCLKRYAYKSYFRKHLIEGCTSDTIVSSPKSSAVKKNTRQTAAAKAQKKTAAKKPVRQTKARKIKERQAKKTVRTI